MKDITSCKNCELYKNQKPSVSKIKQSDIMIIGISAQKNKDNKKFSPLDKDTNSGKFIDEIERSLSKETFYRTNLLKCAPLDNKEKIRYPKKEEYEKCFNNLEYEIKKIRPKIIITLGNKVSDFISKKFKISKEKYKKIKYNDMTIIHIDHPSYIMIYKRKNMDDYKNIILKLLDSSNQ